MRLSDVSSAEIGIICPYSLREEFAIRKIYSTCILFPSAFTLRQYHPHREIPQEWPIAVSFPRGRSERYRLCEVYTIEGASTLQVASC